MFMPVCKDCRSTFGYTFFKNLAVQYLEGYTSWKIMSCRYTSIPQDGSCAIRATLECLINNGVSTKIKLIALS
jgi:hypothetical protein